MRKIIPIQFVVQTLLSLSFVHVIAVDPLPLLSLRLKPHQNLTAAATCSYRVEISTSCSSVSYTRDQISLSFGDAYGYQVYVPRIDNPSSRAFEACSTDTFDISGPCTYDVCYVYLYRRGYDGWQVGSVRIWGSYSKAATFNYNTWIPSDVWYGFNRCNGASSQGSKKPSLYSLMMIMATFIFSFLV